MAVTKIAAPPPIEAKEAWGMLGKSLTSLYKAYESTILYVLLATTWTWVLVTKFN